MLTRIPIPSWHRNINNYSDNNNNNNNNNTFIHACMQLCMHTYMHTHMHAYIHTYMHACVRSIHLSHMCYKHYKYMNLMSTADIVLSYLLHTHRWRHLDRLSGTRKHHQHQFLNREGRWGTTDDFATSFLQFTLFSTTP